jgi:ADP-ribose pyrophosphatase
MVEVVASGKFLRLVKRGKWEFVERVGATGVVAIVAVTSEHRIVLTEQQRPPVQRAVIDLPAGLSGDEPGSAEEGLRTAAERELEEEVGYRATAWAELGEGPPSPGLTSEVVTFFRARGLSKVSQGGGIAGERITVHEVPIENLRPWLEEAKAKGAMIDLKIYAGLFLANL